MANEINITINLAVNKGKVSQNPSVNFKATFTGTNYVQRTMSIPTTAGGTALDVTGLTNLGVGYFKNNDATNYVEILSAVSTGTALVRLLPGEGAIFRFAGAITAPAALANTSAVQLEYMILEQ